MITVTPACQLPGNFAANAFVGPGNEGDAGVCHDTSFKAWYEAAGNI